MQDIDRIFDEYDINKDGKIDFDEFKAIFVAKTEDISPFEPLTIEERTKARLSYSEIPHDR